jgi:hypothetical protein
VVVGIEEGGGCLVSFPGLDQGRLVS